MDHETTPLRAPARVRRVATDRPWAWLNRGWQDMRRARPVGLAYGTGLALFGWVLLLLLFELGAPWAILPATAGFVILAPILAAGLSETSRRLEAGEAPGLGEALGGFRRNGAQLAMIGALLLVIHLFWTRIAGLLFILFFGEASHGLAGLPMAMLRSDHILPFLAIGTGAGCVLAAIAFAAGAVSIPMLVDRPEAGVLEAVTVSVSAVVENWRAMALWAALIVAITALALVPFFLGLVLALPLIGHATWHAYRDLVAPGGLTS